MEFTFNFNFLFLREHFILILKQLKCNDINLLIVAKWVPFKKNSFIYPKMSVFIADILNLNFNYRSWRYKNTKKDIIA